MGCFRELSREELNLVAGGTMQEPDPDGGGGGDGGGGDTGGGSGGTGTGTGTGGGGTTTTASLPQLLTIDPATQDLSWQDVPNQRDGGGNYSSCDDEAGYFDQQMSTGDWDWNSVQAAVNEIWYNAGSQDAATNGVAAYLEDQGLGYMVHGSTDASYNASNGYHGISSGGGSTTNTGGDIVVTAWMQDVPTIDLSSSFAAVAWMPADYMGTGTATGGGGPVAHPYVAGTYGPNQGELNVGLAIVSAHGNGDQSVTYVFADGSTYTTVPGGDHSVRDNNPGNMAYVVGGFAATHGAIGSDGGFAIFANPTAGYNAEDALFDHVNASGTANTGLANTAANWQLMQTMYANSDLSVANNQIWINWTPGQATVRDIIINNSPFNGNNTMHYIDLTASAGLPATSLISSLGDGGGSLRAALLRDIGNIEGYYANGGV